MEVWLVLPDGELDGIPNAQRGWEDLHLINSAKFENFLVQYDDIATKSWPIY